MPLRFPILLLSLAFAAVTHAHGPEKHAPKAFDPALAEQTAFGVAADPKKATRTMTVDMDDRMRFTPETITIRRGETVRFVVRNRGKLMHEMVLGTQAELDKHAEEMKKFPDMEHDDPHMVHVAPGRAGDLAWTFNRTGEFHFACLIPGHYDAGMKGRIIVK